MSSVCRDYTFIQKLNEKTNIWSDKLNNSIKFQSSLTERVFTSIYCIVMSIQLPACHNLTPLLICYSALFKTYLKLFKKLYSWHLHLSQHNQVCNSCDTVTQIFSKCRFFSFLIVKILSCFASTHDTIWFLNLFVFTEKRRHPSRYNHMLWKAET